MSIDPENLQRILEAALLAAARPLDLDELLALFPEQERPDRAALRAALATLASSTRAHAMELREVASGYRIQIRGDYTPWIVAAVGGAAAALLARAARDARHHRLSPADHACGHRGRPRRQPQHRTSSARCSTRRWIRAVGHRDVPGRPALYGTTREFLDYFGLKSLDELPPLAELARR